MRLLRLLAVVFALCLATQTLRADDAPSFLRAPVEVQKQSGVRLKFQTEWAITPDQHAYGLMNRKNMATDRAMLFVFARPQMAAFWMKNTYIPLDMLFISPQRRIVQIAANARPMDETPITAKEPVSFVMEIAGGQALAQGITVGDYLLLPYKTQ